MKYIVVIIAVLCFYEVLFAQELEETQTLKMSVGSIVYMNKLSIPNGVKGNVVGIRYLLSKDNCLNGNRNYLLVDFNTSGLKRNANVYGNKNQYVFYGGKIGIGKDWMLCKVISYLEHKFYMGGFIGTEAEFIKTNQINEDNGLVGANVFGRWTTGVDITIRNQINIEKVVVNNAISVPIIGAGYFPNAPFKSKKLKLPVSYYLQPNDLALFGNIIQLNYEIKLSKSLGKVEINVHYCYRYHCYKKGIEVQKYILHQFGLGIKL